MARIAELERLWTCYRGKIMSNGIMMARDEAERIYGERRIAEKLKQIVRLLRENDLYNAVDIIQNTDKNFELMRKY